MKDKLLKYKAIIIIVLVIISLVIVSVMNAGMNDDGEVIVEKEKTTSKSKKSSDSNEEIKVDIKGEVVNTGVYALKSGSRVMDLIDKAGGLTDKADTELINLSKKLEDENIVIVYSKQEVLTIKANNKLKDSTKTIYECPEVNDACIQESDVVANNTQKDSKKDTTSSDTSKSTKSDSNNEKININTATSEELQTLNGIGQARAEAIIKYREKSGNFNSIEDIKNVSGIGNSLYEKIKDSITV